uniref:Starch-binding domain-containing protein 1 n=1 Tax=Jaculus jaculus TaxID=51337 RepID=A0A8C5K531_JACJA
MGAVWSALLVGGGLAGALFLWLLRGDSGDPEKDGESQKDTPSGEAAAPGGEQGGGGGGPSPGPAKTEPDPKAEHLQECNGHLISVTKGPADLHKAQQLQNPSGADWGNASQDVLNTHSRAYSEVSRNKGLESHAGEQRFHEGQESPAKAATRVIQKLPANNLLVDKAKEVSQDSADHEDWEVLSRHSLRGDVGLGGSLEASGLRLSQGMDCGRSPLVGTGGWRADGKAVSPEPQQVSIRFQVHYATSTDAQFIAVTGDHEYLGKWNAYIPLYYGKDGLWSHSVFLPKDTVVEWKFVLVENGEVTRWEECSNRLLQTGHENKVVHGWWGVH